MASLDSTLKENARELHRFCILLTTHKWELQDSWRKLADQEQLIIRGEVKLEDEVKSRQMEREQLEDEGRRFQKRAGERIDQTRNTLRNLAQEVGERFDLGAAENERLLKEMDREQRKAMEGLKSGINMQIEMKEGLMKEQVDGNLEYLSETSNTIDKLKEDLLALQLASQTSTSGMGGTKKKKTRKKKKQPFADEEETDEVVNVIWSEEIMARELQTPEGERNSTSIAEDIATNETVEALDRDEMMEVEEKTKEI